MPRIVAFCRSRQVPTKDRGDSRELIGVVGDHAGKPLRPHCGAKRLNLSGREGRREDKARNAGGGGRECDEATRRGDGCAIEAEPAPHRTRQRCGIKREADQPAGCAGEAREAKNRIGRLGDGRNDRDASMLEAGPRLAERKPDRQLLNIGASPTGRQDDAVRRRLPEGVEIVIKRRRVHRRNRAKQARATFASARRRDDRRRRARRPGNDQRIGVGFERARLRRIPRTRVDGQPTSRKFSHTAHAPPARLLFMVKIMLTRCRHSHESLTITFVNGPA